MCMVIDRDVIRRLRRRRKPFTAWKVVKRYQTAQGPGLFGCFFDYRFKPGVQRARNPFNLEGWRGSRARIGRYSSRIRFGRRDLESPLMRGVSVDVWGFHVYLRRADAVAVKDTEEVLLPVTVDPRELIVAGYEHGAPSASFRRLAVDPRTYRRLTRNGV